MKRLLGLTLALLLLGGLGLLGASAWLLQSEGGARWLLARLPGVQVRETHGPLAGDFSAAELALSLPSGDRVTLQDLRWSGLQWQLLARAVQLDALSAGQVTVHLAPTPTSAVPNDLRLPVALTVERLRIGGLSLAPLQLQDLEARLQLGPEQHRLQLRSARWQQLSAEGELRLGATAPLATQLSLQLRGAGALPWQGQLKARGPLAELHAEAQLSSQGQALRAEARLQPFAPAPLAALQLRTEQLDLAALHTEWPRTALSGEARLAPEKEALRLHVQLANAAPRRWDQGGLPVQTLALNLRARPGHADPVQLQAVQAQLPGRAQLQGHGQVTPEGRWQFEAQVQGLRPELLDARAVPARLDGPVQVSGGANEGLQLALDLQGQLGASQPLRVQARLHQAQPAWRIEQADILAGPSRASLQGQILPASSPEPTRLALTLKAFNPALLWRGPLPAMRLNGQAQAELHGRAGRIQARLETSELAGLPLAGQLEARLPASGTPIDHALELQWGRNRLQSRGLVGRDHFAGHVTLQAPALADLARLDLPGLNPAPSGRVELDSDLQLSRSGAQWRIEAAGQGSAQDLALGKAFSLARFEGRWRLPALDSPEPLQLALQAQGLTHPRLTLRQLTLKAQGRWPAHQATVELEGSLPLPRGEAFAFSGRSAATGAWTEGRWQGRLTELLLSSSRPNAPALLAAHDLQLVASPQQVSLTPGRAEVAGATVSWRALTWQPEAWTADLTLEPFRVAPVLARWQPDFGWGGDLRVGGTARLQWRGALEADLLLERQGGDLSVTDEFGPQQLGLSELRFAASSHDGVWRFGQGLAGTNLGSFAAAQTLQASGPWPDARSPLQGLVQIQVANLANWGGWVPAGWRLGGQLEASAQLGGRLGAPEWRGTASGQDLALRHPLYGVEFSEGRFKASLDGLHGHLSEVEARAGEGRVRGSGEALLGEAPSARLQLSADKLRVLGRADRRLVASGEAELQLSPGRLQLAGTLRADEGLIDFSHADAPSLGDDVVVQRGPLKAAPAASGPPRQTRVDVALDFGEHFKIVGRGLKTELRGALKLEQRDAKLAVTGKLQAQGGEYSAYGQKLEIERGDLSFTGPHDNPALDLIATRPNTDTRVGVRVTGTAQAPRVALFSEPELPETDKLAWLLLGRGPDGLGRTDTALLQRAALALLSGEGESVTGKVLRGIGLDELSLAQTDDDTRSTIVRLGKQISRRWYVGYERSLNATTGSWQLIYRIAQRFTLRAQSGDDNALDLIWQWRWE